MAYRRSDRLWLAPARVLVFASLAGLAARSAAQGGGGTFFKRPGGGGGPVRSATGAVLVPHDHAGLRDQDGGGRRIVGGTEATGVYEWTTLIQRLGGVSITCTGELISATWMMTAAHCLLNSGNSGYRQPGVGRTEILYGCLDMTDAATCKKVDAKRYIAHPCYTPSHDQDHDDIALIELSSPVLEMQGKFALVNGLNGSVGTIQEGRDIILAGFGARAPDARDGRSSQLMEVTVQVVGKEACIAANPYSYGRQYINFDHIVCTGGIAGKDSCNGDSGGPAIVMHDNAPWLVGVLSKGSQKPESSSNCAVQGRYGMYTLVHQYAGWIEAVLNGKESEWEHGECESCPCVGPAQKMVTTTYGEKAAKGIGVYVEIVLFFHVPAADFQLGSSSRANVVSALAAAADQEKEVVTIMSAQSVSSQSRRQSRTRVEARIGTMDQESKTVLILNLSVKRITRELTRVNLPPDGIAVVGGESSDPKKSGLSLIELIGVIVSGVVVVLCAVTVVCNWHLCSGDTDHRISPKEPLGVLPIRVCSPCSKAESGVTAGMTPRPSETIHGEGQTDFAHTPGYLLYPLPSPNSSVMPSARTNDSEYTTEIVLYPQAKPRAPGTQHLAHG